MDPSKKIDCTFESDINKFTEEKVIKIESYLYVNQSTESINLRFFEEYIKKR
jgi:hypothetical protein